MTMEFTEIEDDMKKVCKQQTGGSHYQDLKITPIEYAMANNLNACEFSVVKYVSRHRLKNGKEDLLKAKDFIDMLIEHEYGELK
jgi:hypothetical protein